MKTVRSSTLVYVCVCVIRSGLQFIRRLNVLHRRVSSGSQHASSWRNDFIPLPLHQRDFISAYVCWSVSRLISRISKKNMDRFVWTTDVYKVPDAVPLIHAVSSHVATDKDPSKFRSIFSDNLQPIATRGKKARGTLLDDIVCSSKRAPLFVSYYNEISSGHIGSCCCQYCPVVWTLLYHSF